MRALPRWAWILGYAGLLPFFVLTMALLLKQPLPALEQARIDWWLAAYAAIVLSFIGAVHWGVVLGMQDWVNELDSKQLLQFSVLPGLLAWLALLLPIKACLLAMAILLAFTYIADRWFLYSRLKLHPDYLKLRQRLTIIAVILLLAAASVS